LLPDEKLTVLKSINKENLGKKISFIGDGINDSPVLAASDVGIAMCTMVLV
jgi:Cd2+/Zn2+-exporting ATPase